MMKNIFKQNSKNFSQFQVQKIKNFKKLKHLSFVTNLGVLIFNMFNHTYDKKNSMQIRSHKSTQPALVPLLIIARLSPLFAAT